MRRTACEREGCATLARSDGGIPPRKGEDAPCIGKVSIVIPVYNRERYIKEAVDSALGQTYPDTEVVVVDDCSTDGTAGILAGYGDAIRAVRHERNRGVGAAFATGVAAMKGEWFKGLGSDDVLYPDAVEQLAGANAALGPNDKVIPFMSMGTVDGRTYPWQPGPMINALDGFGQAVLLLDEFFGVHATCMFRRELVDRIGFNPAYRAFEDWDVNLRLLLDGYRFVHVERTIYGYRMHGEQMSRAYMGRDEQEDRRRFREMVGRALSGIDAGRRGELRAAAAAYQKRKWYLHGKWVAANPSRIPAHPSRVRGEGGRIAAWLGKAVRSHPLAWTARRSLHGRSARHLAGALAWYAGFRGERWDGRGLGEIHFDFVQYGMAPRDVMPSHVAECEWIDGTR